MNDHSCRMPWWRSRWRHRVYVCKCLRQWTAVAYMWPDSQLSDVGPTFTYHWKELNG